MKFQDLGIDDPILKAIREIGYEEPTPIQQQAIPPVLEGRDLLGCAQTGTGKTAAFAIPILQRLGRPEAGEARPVRALILTPTRELALQIYENLCQYGRYTGRISAVIYGGVSQNPQVEALRSGADILVATPGRLWDLMGQKLLDIGHVECFVLDEADRMLDMGFINDVKKIIAKLPHKRQTLLFSATMPGEIAELAETLLHRPVHVSITPAATPVELIEQGVYFAEKKAKRELLQVILRQKNIPQTLVFTRTKHGADRVARDLNRAGIPARSIHGDKSQGARQTALKMFKEYKIPVLVATDIAARGIDISELPLVINFDLPNIPETYVHRIGRTGRAGQEGTALSFCDASELPYLRDIEALTRVPIPALEPPEGIEMTEAQQAARYVRSEPAAASRQKTGRKKAKVSAAAAEAPVQKKASEETPAESGKSRRRRKKAVETPAAEEAPRQTRGRRKSEPAPAPAQTEEPRRGRGRKKAEPAAAAPVAETRQTRGKKKAAAAPAALPRVRTRGRSGLQEARAAMPHLSAPRGQRKGRGRREELDTRVDVMTLHTGRQISESTAARIRAKVESKLAERRAAQQSQTAARAAQAKEKKKNPPRRGQNRPRH